MSAEVGIQRNVKPFQQMEKMKYFTTNNLFEQFLYALTLQIHKTFKMKQIIQPDMKITAIMTFAIKVFTPFNDS